MGIFWIVLSVLIRLVAAYLLVGVATVRSAQWLGILGTVMTGLCLGVGICLPFFHHTPALFFVPTILVWGSLFLVATIFVETVRMRIGAFLIGLVLILLVLVR